MVNVVPNTFLLIDLYAYERQKSSRDKKNGNRDQTHQSIGCMQASIHLMPSMIDCLNKLLARRFFSHRSLQYIKKASQHRISSAKELEKHNVKQNASLQN
jgi:hypothetical protein